MLRLRPYKQCDAQHIVSWTKDEAAFYFWSFNRLGTYPLSADSLNAYYDKLRGDTRHFEMTLTDEQGKALGHIILRYTDEALTRVRLGFIIVDPLMRGKHYGKAMVKLACRYAFDYLGASAVTLGVFEANTPAINCYKAAGFSLLPDTSTAEIGGVSHIMLEMEMRAPHA